MSQCFFILSETKFQLDTTKDIELPHRLPIVKIAQFWQHNVITKSGQFLQWRFGEISHFWSDATKI